VVNVLVRITLQHVFLSTETNSASPITCHSDEDKFIQAE
jgi:hypothetical protein